MIKTEVKILGNSIFKVSKVFDIKTKLIVFSLLIIVVFPHVNIRVLQKQNGIDLKYTPNHMNHYWTRFDDIVKLYPAFQLSRNYSLKAKINTNEHKGNYFPNVVQESVSSLLYSSIILVCGLILISNKKTINLILKFIIFKL